MKVVILESQLKEIVNHYCGLANEKVQLREDSSCDIFTRTTRRHDYDDTLNGVTPRVMKNLTGTIVKMSPDEYFRKCAEIQRTTVKEQYSYIDQRRVNTLIEKISSNIKVDIPMIDFINNFQEGRHRAYAAKKLGCEQIEVAVFTKTPRDFDEDEEFTINDGKWNDVFTDGERTFVSYDYTDRKQMKQFYSLFDSPEYGLSDIVYTLVKGMNDNLFNTVPGPIVDVDRINFEKKPEKLIDLMVNVISKNISTEEYYDDNDNEGDTLEMVLKYRSFDELFENIIMDNYWSENKKEIKKLQNYIISMVTGIFESMKYYDDYYSIKNNLDEGYTLKFGNDIIKLYINNSQVFDGSVDTYQNFKDLLEDRNEPISDYTYQYIENYISDNKRYEIRVKDVDKFLSKYSFSI